MNAKDAVTYLHDLPPLTEDDKAREHYIELETRRGMGWSEADAQKAAKEHLAAVEEAEYARALERIKLAQANQ